MRTLARCGTLPVALAVLTGVTALYYALVAFGNSVDDYWGNWNFVDNVFDMGTTFGKDALGWRSIKNNTLVTIAYIGVIIWEWLIAAVLATAFVQGLKGNHQLARRLSTLGWTMVLVLFFGGFLTVGGEWFAMWQSSNWNGTDPAFRNITIAGLGLILANLPTGFKGSEDRDSAPETNR